MLQMIWRGGARRKGKGKRAWQTQSGTATGNRRLFYALMKIDGKANSEK